MPPAVALYLLISLGGATCMTGVALRLTTITDNRVAPAHQIYVAAPPVFIDPIVRRR